MKHLDRLVKCYRFRLNFHVYEEYDDDGRLLYVSTCPFIVTHSDREYRPKCDGLDEFGHRCVYADPRPLPSDPEAGPRRL